MKKSLYIIGLLLLFSPLSPAQTPVALMPVPRMQFFNSTGQPLAGGCVNFFAAGTSTPQAIYADSGGMNQLPNPLTLDAAGEAAIYLSNTAYKVVVNTGVVGQPCSLALGTQLWAQDNVSSYAVITQAQNLFLSCGTSDPSGTQGEMGCRSDLGKMRFFFSIWDSLVEETVPATLTNKTFDISANTLKTATNTAGHFVRNNGTQYVDGSIQSTDIPPQYTKFECAPGLGDGLNSITAGTYLQFNCVNKSGVTWTITGISCWTDNNGTSTLQVANNAATNLLTGAVTCNNTKSGGGVAGTQSATVTLANNDALSFTFVADGTTKQTTWTVTLTQ